MKIYDESGQLIATPDLDKGWLETAQCLVARHPEEPGRPAVTHTEVMAGTKNLRKLVVDQPEVPAKDAWDEYEAVQVYHPYTSEELAQREQSAVHDREYERRLAALERMMLEGSAR